MEQVEARSELYKHISVTRGPRYEEFIEANKIVTQFIIDKKLVVYGGTAIDFALRLHGDKIYPDDQLAIADLDFYSHDNVNHAYELADILYAAGFEDTKCVTAIHPMTMKVGIGDKTWVADISYVPPNVKLDYIMYESMRIIDPTFQRISQHSSLAFPYAESPREVIFHRCMKDITRFNMIDKYYPIKIKSKPTALVDVPIPDIKLIYGGYVAYAVYSHIYNLKHTTVHPKSHIGLKNKVFMCMALKSVINIYSNDFELVHKQLGLKELQHFRKLMDNRMPHTKAKMGKYCVEVDDIRQLGLSYTTVTVLKTKLMLVSAQYLLKWCIVTGEMDMYQGMLKMTTDMGAMDAAFGLQLDVPNQEMYSDSQQLAILRAQHRKNKVDLNRITVPISYTPAKKGVVPVFDYSTSVYYMADGGLIRD